jgi:ClpP class serine protease
MKANIYSFAEYLSNIRWYGSKESLQALMTTLMADPLSFFGDDIPQYSDESAEMAKKLANKLLNDKEPIHISVDFSNPDIEENSIAYHRVFGSILADDRWNYWFSTKRFIDDVKAAEKNPQINAHFIHVSSGGGEAWLLDKAFDAVKNATKPVIAFIEKVGASAGLYLPAPADKIYIYTQNCTVGSLGTMIYFWDFAPYWEKEGAVQHEHYAHKSDFKNKKFNDLLKGGKHAEKYITEELDPLQEQFENAVRSVRPKINELPDDHPVVRGETYAAPQAIEIGLVDQMAEIETAIQDCHDRGMSWKKKQKAQQTAYSFL